MIYPRRYPKNLTRLTTFRLSDDLRLKAEECADYLGISFSDFIRQSINRNINVAMGIEAEVNRQATNRAIGR
jgi:antitoxin component of RelBE/YafQ-DinJ toxin-antitoxin module